MTLNHSKIFLKKLILWLFVLSLYSLKSQIILTSNVGNILSPSGMISCESDDEKWGKVFELSDFGITPNDQFIIETAQVGISKSYAGAYLGIAVFAIDDNFPNSQADIINGGGYQMLPVINGTSEVINFNLSNPIVVPAGVKRILVTAVKSVDYYNPNSAEVIIARTENDTGASYYKGCRKYYSYTNTNDLDTPVPDANFFINVTGRKLSASSVGKSTTLTHNICDYTIETGFPSCSSGMQQWARAFVLEDFGISKNEEFIINSGQIAIESTGGGATVTFHIYEIDENFPTSFSDTNLLGSSEEVQINYESGSDILGTIYEIPFNTPVVVNANVERVLVMAQVGAVWGDGVIFIAGTEQDYDHSWFRGCVIGEYETFTIVNEDFNFFINVTGDVNHVSNNFGMNISNICAEFLKEFSIEGSTAIASVLWNFGDPTSGVNNESTDISPYHDFSADGTYTITAKVTATNGSIEFLTETIDVKEPPKAYGINNLVACEATYGTGISSSFDTSTVLSEVLGTQTDKVVTFIDGSGNTYSVLPNPFTNTVRDRETITVQVKRADELCCLSETTFDLIVNPVPNVSSVQDLTACENNTDGFSTFDLTQIYSNLEANNTAVDFYFEDGLLIPNSQLNTVVNKIQYQESITVKLTNKLTNCYNETTFKLVVSPSPIANTLNDIIGCDDNNDGISEYFDTSTIETTVIGNQVGMEVSYFDANGNLLASPLPNPYTNTVPNNETITVRVTNSITNCYTETNLNLTTSTKPTITQPTTLYACNEGSGFAFFDTSTIESQLVGVQTGLQIFYFDENGVPLPSPLPINYQNSTAWSQKINVRVENQLNPLCFSETSFNLNVNELPKISLENTYFLCDLEPSLYITTDPTFDSWKWTFENGSEISNAYEANLVDAGTYTLHVTKTNNGVTCENSFSFNLVRSVLPTITDVKIEDISSNNSIEIITSGDGDFEYAIDGINFQDEAIFENLVGGIYTVEVRDKKGCGGAREEVVLVDYPDFFTPNNDGFNDTWHIQGVEKFPNAIVYIFDRFGKLLKKISSDHIGWDGFFNGKNLPSSDYWFTANLGDGRNFKGHFSLIR